jgi:hypothetical protein
MRKAGIICDMATSKKYKLMKKENSLYKVRGRKLQGVYLALETAFAGNREVCSCPTDMVRCVVGSCSSSASDSPSGPSPSWIPDVLDFEDMKLGSRRDDPSFDKALGFGW